MSRAILTQIQQSAGQARRGPEPYGEMYSIIVNK